jgi:CRISPR/Cas system Type II protein with McrA/HNH and RuvC-like nuclease domain
MTRAEHQRRPGRSSKWIGKTRRVAIYLRDDFACVYCGRDLRRAEPREVGLDHLVPQSKGGSHESTNLVTACSSCNCGRQDKPWRSFATPGAVERISRLRRRALNLKLALALRRGESTSRCEG